MTQDPGGRARGQPTAGSRSCASSPGSASAPASGCGWGAEPAQQYLSGYMIELSLSVDNVFVFALVFEHFDVDEAQRRRLLLWGVVGAVVLRSAFIVAGITAIERFAWIIPLFGAFILGDGDPAGREPRAQGVRPVRQRRGPLHLLPRAGGARGPRGDRDGRPHLRLDSLPAVLAVTHDVFIAMASNLFAILGLRSLFFVVSDAVKSLRYLKVGLAAILSFVGVKMLAEPWYRVPTPSSLAVIAVILAASVGASLLAARRDRR